jgi:DNA polymerase (family X)
VVRILKEIAGLLRVREESPYRVRAYETGASRIGELKGDLGELSRSGRIKKLPGIGDALAAKVAEILETGRSELHDELMREYPPGLLELTQLAGVGPKRAQLLWKALAVGDVDELERACRQGRVREVPGFTERSEARLLDAIAAHRSAPPPAVRSRLGDALPRAVALLERVRLAPGVQRAELAGALRRGCEEVDELTLVVAAAEPRRVLRAFDEANITPLPGGGFELALPLEPLKVEFWFAPRGAFAATWLAHTGTQGHLEKLSELAVGVGLPLATTPLATEEAIYEALGLAFISPELREDLGELEAAQQGTLPHDLVRLQDLVGVVHSHSTWSDGRATLEQMALAARERGLAFLTVTEHSQSAGYAGGLEPERLQRQWKEIDRLNAQLEGITLLKGIESDILADGSLDYPDALLAKLDVVIGSVHQRHKMDRAQMTRRILRAFDNPHLHILGHATGRLLQRRDPSPMDMDAILDAAAARGVAVEINGNPERLDLKASHVRKAVARGVRLVCSADAHSTRELDHLAFAVSTARRGWARKKDILNTRGAEAFSAELRLARRH